jgi:PKD repeat protein
VFTNTSVNSSSYQWTFQDQNNSTSNAVSPTFVYQALGEYQPELTAFNAQNCFHTTSRTVRVVLPVVDIALDGLELMEFQNGFKPAVTIFNRGNVPVINPALLLNMSGSVIREHVNTTITSNTSYRHVFSFEFPASSDVDYFCVEAEVTDITPTDNEVCLSLEQTFTIFPPYPNPSKGSFQLDWIMKEAGPVNLTVINSMGQEMQNLHIESMEGLNPFTVETHGLSSGVYFVKIKYKQFTQVYRVFVSE